MTHVVLMQDGRLVFKDSYGDYADVSELAEEYLIN